ncbi:unnamed protein product [Parnassius apollo]|uniref:(apollo) hypothetical protein n=1 Tax=Parnassius apollo TaxID=110799 RepID=A0A8S3WPB6_PARAO|nr:unnamed protein product [Parnassius apollo]
MYKADLISDVMSVKLESESNTDNEIESNETLEDYTKKNHIVTLENIKLYVNKNLNNKLNGGANVCDKRKLTTEVNTKKKRTKLADEGTNSDYESGAPGLPFKKKRTEIVHKKCVTTYLGQDFKPTETQSTDNELRRGLPLQIIGELVIEHDNNQMEVDDVNPTIDHVHKPRQIIGDRFNKRPKTSAERVREFRARKAMLKQQSKQQQEPNKKGVSETSKKQAKTAAQRMREYRQRQKLAKKIPLEPQSDQDLDAIVSTSSSQQQIKKSERAREYRDRRNDNINIESNNPSGNNEQQSDLTLILKLWFKNDLKKVSDKHEDLLKKITNINNISDAMICSTCKVALDKQNIPIL